MKSLENLLNLLSNRNLSYYDFVARAKNSIISDKFDVKDVSMWQMQGLSIERFADKIELKTRTNSINEQEFCIVDIETSGGMSSGQIIEIGAVKIKNAVEISHFQSLVHATNIPESISELTGIYDSDLVDAPPLAKVLENFRVYLGDAVFVAHNVNFDYNFISHSLESMGFGMLLNRKICTIELARRTIKSERYGLESLKNLLGINSTHHRALSDARAACEVFKTSLMCLPNSVKHTEELIKFSKSAPKHYKDKTPSLEI
ncbi:3'-5' exonuclease [Campylobacter majalis]|uniref:3'-5' exonuclease n=1 Tax=Campylobacter majalis TaxID=2790656 RepID=UPI003D689179